MTQPQIVDDFRHNGNGTHPCTCSPSAQVHRTCSATSLISKMVRVASWRRRSCSLVALSIVKVQVSSWSNRRIRWYLVMIEVSNWPLWIFVHASNEHTSSVMYLRFSSFVRATTCCTRRNGTIARLASNSFQTLASWLFWYSDTFSTLGTSQLFWGNKKCGLYPWVFRFLMMPVLHGHMDPLSRVFHWMDR